MHELFSALKGGTDDAAINRWVDALRAWHRVIANDSYWTLTLTLEEKGGFEPAALPSEIEALRNDAVRIASEPLAVAARDAQARNDAPTLHRILKALQALNETGEWAANVQEDIASPILENLRELSTSIREQCGAKIVHDPDASKGNREACDFALKRFRGEIQPELSRLIDLVSTDHQLAKRAREETAKSLASIAIGYTWADDFICSQQLHEEALELARDTVSAIRIEHGLEEVREAASKQRVLGPLTPISSAPALFSFNGIGVTIYGRSDYDRDTNSYVTTHYFVLLFVPIFPIARYRVIDAEGGKYRFLGKLPLRKFDRWHFAISLAVIAAAVVWVTIETNYPNAARSTTYSSSTTTTQSPGAAQRRSTLKTEIEFGRAKIAALKPRIDPVIDQLTRFNTQMDQLSSELKALDERQKTGVRVDAAIYNSKVDTYNAILARHRAMLSANESDVKAYNELLDRDSVLVDQYNALAKR
ncbi:MAG: hypothetical protein NTV56_18945 [Alphaproteobacteria bacterium]|nr:hypothetical protein [Alphaproteobacteria bacterium]